MRSIITPLCRRIGLSPVGSPITAARPNGRPASASARAPDIELSSSQVARINSGCLKGWSSSGNAASITSAKNPFMSQLPSPTQRPSTSVSLSGSVFHSAASYGTVSLCPANTKPPGPLPKLANRLNLPGLTGWISMAKPRSPSQAASRSITGRLLWSRDAWVQLTDGAAIKAANCSFIDGKGMRGLPTSRMNLTIEASAQHNKPLRHVAGLSPVHCTTLAATLFPGCAPDPGFSGHAERNRNQATRQPRNTRRAA